MTARDPMGLKATIDLSIIILSSIAVVVIVIIIIIVMSSSIVLVLVASQRSPVTSHRSPSPPSPPLVAASTVTAPGPPAPTAPSKLGASWRGALLPPPQPLFVFVFLRAGHAWTLAGHRRTAAARALRAPVQGAARSARLGLARREHGKPRCTSHHDALRVPMRPRQRHAHAHARQRPSNALILP